MEETLGILSVNLTLTGLKAIDFRHLFREGNLLSFRVLEKGSKGSYTLFLGGRKVEAKSTVPLPLGRVLHSRVLQKEGGLRLELLKPFQPRATLLQNLGLEGRAGAEAVVRGLMQSGAPLNPRVIRRILNYTSKEPNKRRFFARLTGNLGRKGMDLSQPGWEAVIDACLADYYGQGREDDKHRRGQKHPRGEEKLPDLRSVKAMWAPGDKPNLLHLYNHIKGRGENWLFLPISSRFRGRKLLGALEVQFRGDGKMVKACIRVKDGKEDWFFRLGPPGPEGRRKLQWEGPPRWEARGKDGLGVFSKKLRNLGIDLDDTRINESEGTELPPGGVNWIV